MWSLIRRRLRFVIATKKKSKKMTVRVATDRTNGNGKETKRLWGDRYNRQKKRLNEVERGRSRTVLTRLTVILWKSTSQHNNRKVSFPEKFCQCHKDLIIWRVNLFGVRKIVHFTPRNYYTLLVRKGKCFVKARRGSCLFTFFLRCGHWWNLQIRWSVTIMK